MKIVNDEKKLLGLIAQPNLKSVFRYENSNLVFVNMGKSVCTLNKPIYLGQAILDQSKTLMYDFHYNYIKRMYGPRARLLFTDTDSLCYDIRTEDFYNDIRDDVPTWFDTSDYPSDHPAGLPIMNKKEIGFFKDENKSKQMIEFVGLRPKLYACQVENSSAHKKAKGTKKAVVKKELTFNDYKNCLFENKTTYVKFNVFRSRHHNITTETVTKIALSSKDDKRIIIPNDPEHKTLALYHWRSKTPALYDIDLNTQKLFKAGSLMNLAYNAL